MAVDIDVWHSCGVDLAEWIAAEHDFVRVRFRSAVAAHVPADRWRERDGEHGSSIAWLLFHTTLHQDLAMNTAIRNHAPLIAEHRRDLGLDGYAAHAGLSEAEEPRVTAALDLDALERYVDAVNDGTQAWIARMSTMALDTIPPADWRLEHKADVAADGEMSWLHRMWTDKPVSWFVQWECIGHGQAHVGEMVGIRSRLGLSPF